MPDLHAADPARPGPPPQPQHRPLRHKHNRDIHLYSAKLGLGRTPPPLLFTYNPPSFRRQNIFLKKKGK